MLSLSNDARVAEQQMHAVIFYLTAFGYIDGDFDRREKEIVRDQIGRLVDGRAALAMGDSDPGLRRELVARWTAHFHEVLDEVDKAILDHFAEPVAEGEDSMAFVTAKLKLRCYELFKQFDEDNRGVLLNAVDEIMYADGVVHPSESAFRAELAGLLSTPIELDDSELEPVAEGALLIDPAREIEAREANHPFFDRYEWDYARDPAAFARQAQLDMELIEKTLAMLGTMREKGRGRLGAAQDVSEFAGSEPFLDGHVFVLPPKPARDYELLVLGDLHGCYSCLKAALMQADFFAKVQASHDDPEKHPAMKLVLLGDYIDRGKFSYNGILRTVMQLFVTVPDDVYILRGNHEYYVELNGRVYGGVKPAEAISDLVDIAPTEVFLAYKKLFEALPNSLVFDRTFFVHAGIPRDDTLAAKWSGLASLNDEEIRFQMLWSDPSEAEYIPGDLQKANARFPFGKRQFRSFMSRLGCTTMVRGHERIVEGFKIVYDEPDARLLNLFSAGGKTNNDLPETSNYREVTPMALTIRHKDGITHLTPFALDYERYNDPAFNRFFKEPASAVMPGV